MSSAENPSFSVIVRVKRGSLEMLAHPWRPGGSALFQRTPRLDRLGNDLCPGREGPVRADPGDNALQRERLNDQRRRARGVRDHNGIEQELHVLRTRHPKCQRGQEVRRVHDARHQHRLQLLLLDRSGLQYQPHRLERAQLLHAWRGVDGDPYLGFFLRC